MRVGRSARTVAAAAIAGALTMTGIVAAEAATKPKPFKIGVITCKTGNLAAYGDAYLEGLEAGLKWVEQKKLAGNRKIQIISTVDDKAADSEAAAAGFKSMVGQGAKVILGTCSSAIATNLAPLATANNVLYMPGPAALDQLSGINRNTFRTGRQSLQDVATAMSYLGTNPSGKKVVALVEDVAFGVGNAVAVDLVMAGKGATVVPAVKVPLGTADITTYAKKVKDEKADVVFVAWAGFIPTPPWTALKQQGVLEDADVVTGLANRATWNATGAVTGSDVKFLAHYIPGAAGTAEEKFLAAELAKKNKQLDLFSPDGFNAALMVARAASANPARDNVNRMIKALEGWSFNSVKGRHTIRKDDHALIQPMFRAALIRQGREWNPVRLATVQGVTPPIVTTTPFK